MSMETEHFNDRFLSTEFPGGTLAGHVFEDCVFEKCDFKGVGLEQTRFVSCTFISCDLSNAALTNSRMRAVSFESCKLIGVQWFRLESLISPSFKECNLNYANFNGLKLKKTSFVKCLLRDADFSGADLSESNLKEADLLNARFHDTLIMKTDFRGAQNYVIDPILNKVQGARFSMPEAQGLLTGLGVVID